MGEVADMMIDGTLCEGCGVVLDGDSPGFPRLCRHCEEDERIANIDRGARQLAASMRVTCPACGKRVKQAGLADHQRDVHAEGKSVAQSTQEK